MGFFSALLGKWLPHNSKWQIKFVLSWTKLSPMTKWASVSFLRTMRGMECHNLWSSRHVFGSEEGENGRVSITEEGSLRLTGGGGKLWPPQASQGRSWSPLVGAVSRRLRRWASLKKTLIPVSVLSYSAISPYTPPNPIHLTLQSSSSRSPAVSIFYFPLSWPPHAHPPALSVFSNPLPTVQPVSRRFFIPSLLSPLSYSIRSEFLLFDKVEAPAVLEAA